MEQLTVTFKGKNYTSKPMNVGNFIDFTKMKSLLSDGQYGAIWRMATGHGDETLLMIDIQAFINVFFDNIVKDMKVPIKELGLSDYKEVRKLYVEKMFAWVDRHTKVLNDVDEKEPTKE